MRQPKFSIITCTKDSEAFLQECLDSVSKQTYRDFEHIFIDGESKDQTVKILKQYKKQAKDIKVKIVSYPPMGIPDAFNKGVENASGEFLLFLNSDDFLISPKGLEAANRYINEKPEIEWLQGRVRVQNGKRGINSPKLIFPTVLGQVLMSVWAFLPHQGAFIRKSVFDKYGAYEEYPTSTDYKYWLDHSWKIKIRYVNDIFATFRMHPGSTTSSPKNIPKTINNVFKTWFDSRNIPFVSGVSKGIKAAKQK